jgi:hypothetical protein
MAGLIEPRLPGTRYLKGGKGGKGDSLNCVIFRQDQNREN